MQTTTLYHRLKTLGVSAPYASQIARGTRAPGLILAIRIWRATGLKLGPIAGASRAAIARLEHMKLARLPGRKS